MAIDPIGEISDAAAAPPPGPDMSALFDREVNANLLNGTSPAALRLADGSAYFHPGTASDAPPAPAVPAPESAPPSPPTIPRLPLGPGGAGIAAVAVGAVVDQHARGRAQEIETGEDHCGGRFFCFTSMADGSFGSGPPLAGPLTGPASPGRPPPLPGFALETRTQEERDLVDGMLGQGKNATEIQNALFALRAQRAEGFRAAATVKPNDPHPSRTMPSGPLGGVVYGRPEAMPTGALPGVKSGFRGQNDALARMADAGYRVLANPTVSQGPDGKPVLTPALRSGLGLDPRQEPRRAHRGPGVRRLFAHQRQCPPDTEHARRQGGRRSGTSDPAQSQGQRCFRARAAGLSAEQSGCKAEGNHSHRRHRRYLAFLSV